VSKQIARLDQQLERLAPQCAPHDQAIAAAKQDVNDARHQTQVAGAELTQAGRLHRHSARHRLDRTDKRLTTQQAALDQTLERARPVLDQRDQLTAKRDGLQIEQAANQRDLHAAHTRLETTTDTLHALTTWHDWAAGHHITNTKIVDAAIALHHRGGHHAHLAAPLLDWCEQRNLITFEPPQPQPEIQRRSRGIEIDF
jgi:chromosome segregation ATPase